MVVVVGGVLACVGLYGQPLILRPQSQFLSSRLCNLDFYLELGFGTLGLMSIKMLKIHILVNVVK